MIIILLQHVNLKCNKLISNNVNADIIIIDAKRWLTITNYKSQSRFIPTIIYRAMITTTLINWSFRRIIIIIHNEISHCTSKGIQKGSLSLRRISTIRSVLPIVRRISPVHRLRINYDETSWNKLSNIDRVDREAAATRATCLELFEREEIKLLDEEEFAKPGWHSSLYLCSLCVVVKTSPLKRRRSLRASCYFRRSKDSFWRRSSDRNKCFGE